MSFEKFKAWARFIFIVLLIVVAAVIIVMNHGNKTNLWVFHTFHNVPVLLLILVTAILSPIGWAIVKNVYHAWCEVARYSKAEKRKESSDNKGENVEVEQ